MYRAVSAPNFAIAHVRASGTARPDDLVVIDHTDCDSVLSAGIISGRLDPDERLAKRPSLRITSGVENPIANLLQAIEYRRDLDCRSARSKRG